MKSRLWWMDTQDWPVRVLTIYADEDGHMLADVIDVNGKERQIYFYSRTMDELACFQEVMEYSRRVMKEKEDGSLQLESSTNE